MTRAAAATAIATGPVAFAAAAPAAETLGTGLADGRAVRLHADGASAFDRPAAAGSRRRSTAEVAYCASAHGRRTVRHGRRTFGGFLADDAGAADVEHLRQVVIERAVEALKVEPGLVPVVSLTAGTVSGLPAGTIVCDTLRDDEARVTATTVAIGRHRTARIARSERAEDSVPCHRAPHEAFVRDTRLTLAGDVG